MKIIMLSAKEKEMNIKWKRINAHSSKQLRIECGTSLATIQYNTREPLKPRHIRLLQSNLCNNKDE